MPPTKAPKKAAKKAAKKHSPEHDRERYSKDTRRCYEHLGRVDILSSCMQSGQLGTVHELVKLAQASLAANYAKDGADLLRAAEHLCFAVAFEERGVLGSVSKKLETAINEEWRHLQDRAADRASHDEMPPSVQTIFAYMSKVSASAMKAKKYRYALEMARGAEALAHVSNDIKALPPGRQNKLLA